MGRSAALRKVLDQVQTVAPTDSTVLIEGETGTGKHRGFYSADNVDHCQQAGVSQVCIPQRGGQKTAEQAALEHSRAFKQGQRFRVGIEGRISVLFRGRGMKRCRAKGRERFEVLVGAAVLANNLLRIAELLRNRKPARHSKAA